MSNSRLPAEWEPQDAVLLSWPHAGTDWSYMLGEVRACFGQIALEIARRARVCIVAPDPEATKAEITEMLGEAGSAQLLDRFIFIEAATNDTWARDFGPICTIGNDRAVTAHDFKFNGWGLKFAANHDNMINTALLRAGCLQAGYANHLSFVLEGGSIDTDGNGAILTTEECLLSANRNGGTDKEGIERFILEALGCNRMIWLRNGAISGDDTDSHVDTLARFLPSGKIAYASCDRADDVNYAGLEAMCRELEQLSDGHGRSYELTALPIPEPIYDEDGMRLPATYANFLILNGAVLLPVYGDGRYDAIAIEAMQQAMPGYEIVAIDCRALIKQHGSLHCVTMQLPCGALS